MSKRVWIQLKCCFNFAFRLLFFYNPDLITFSGIIYSAMIDNGTFSGKNKTSSKEKRVVCQKVIGQFGMMSRKTLRMFSLRLKSNNLQANIMYVVSLKNY